MTKLFVVNKVYLTKKTILFVEKEQTLKNILRYVSEYTGVAQKDFKNKSKERIYTTARMLFFAYSYDFIDKSLQTIADVLDKTHSAIIYAHNNVQFTYKKEYEAFLNYMLQKGFKMDKVNREFITKNNK